MAEDDEQVGSRAIGRDPADPVTADRVETKSKVV
jgi:hypothetical protein